MKELNVTENDLAKVDDIMETVEYYLTEGYGRLGIPYKEMILDGLDRALALIGTAAGLISTKDSIKIVKERTKRIMISDTDRYFKLMDIKKKIEIKKEFISSCAWYSKRSPKLELGVAVGLQGVGFKSFVIHKEGVKPVYELWDPSDVVTEKNGIYRVYPSKNGEMY